MTQLQLFDVCDCCGRFYVYDQVHRWRGPRHKACARAWDAWLRHDNRDDWATMPTRQEAVL